MNNLIIIILIFFIFLLFYSHYLEKERFLKEIFPKDIIFPLDETIKLPEITRENFIPKTIYRTHKNEETLKKYQEVLDETKQLLPDYKTRIFFDNDIENYIKENFSERIYNAYKSINPRYGSSRADFFRYLIIYKEGGIYLDIKSGPVKNLDDIIENLNGKLAYSNWRNFPLKYLPFLYFDQLYFAPFLDNWYGEYQNWYIISGKGNPLLKKVIQQMVSNIEEGKKDINIYSQGVFSVLAMTGPIMFTKVIDKYQNNNDCQYFKNNLNNHLKYKIIDHKIIEKNNHYSENINKKILL